MRVEQRCRVSTAASQVLDGGADLCSPSGDVALVSVYTFLGTGSSYDFHLVSHNKPHSTSEGTSVGILPVAKYRRTSKVLWVQSQAPAIKQIF